MGGKAGLSLSQKSVAEKSLAGRGRARSVIASLIAAI